MRHLVVCAIVTVLALPAYATAAQKESAPINGDAAYYFLFARHLEGQDRLDEAVAALQRALALVPESAEVRAELSAMYARQDKPLEALTAAEEALKRDPNNRVANRILGTILSVFWEIRKPVREGEDPNQYQARAIDALIKARGDGSDLNLLLTLGRLQLRAGRYDDAATSLKRVFEEQPQFTEGAMLLAAAQEGAGRLADAAATLEGALEENPRSRRALVRLGDVRYRQERYAEAIAAWERAIEGQGPSTDRDEVEKKVRDARSRLLKR